MLVSVVIPCYNSGEFLSEAVNSALEFPREICEVIIVNDGSTDQYTIDLLSYFRKEGLMVIDQDNAGPGKARNRGISVSKAEYIIPLDADNVLNSGVFQKALEIMEKEQDISIVYTDIEMIGERTGLWKVGAFNSKTILLRNQIDTCTLIRKSAFNEIGGYDESPEVISHEDWDLWIRMFQGKKRFFYLEEVGFKYRVRPTSLLTQIGIPKHESIRSFFVKKYAYPYYQLLLEWESEISELHSLRTRLKNRFRNIIKLILNKPL